jgi:arabinogalactan endo-1,4-beta-galactosidase
VSATVEIELYEVAATAELWAFQVASVLVKDVGLTTFELNNELDNQCIQLVNGNAPDGSLPSQFNETKYSYYRAMLRGLIAGVKRASPAATTIVNTGGWLHYGWYSRLVADQVDFDIIGYHWYSGMGDFNDTGTHGGHTNVLQELGRYKKKIWITEMNHQGGSSAGSPAQPDPSGESVELLENSTD